MMDLLEDAKAAGFKGGSNWRQYREAVMIYRSKGWRWPQIWERMVQLGCAVHDRKRYESFRSSMGEYEREQKARMKQNTGA
ncbi:MAG: hypothetical protein EOP86_27820 [Verrucomicrobiaceae bacterium]|nr:MAG: hypothetical protein EOP86_27820 [Verrucomicrobiaceae bacterium]